MSGPIFTNWFIGAGVVVGIVLVVAVLLIAINLAARRVLRLADAALVTAKKIQANTQSIWALKQTNEVATRILAEAESIRDHGAHVVDVLHQQDKDSAA